MHLSFLEHIRILKLNNENIDIEELVKGVVGFYNATIHSTTNVRPIDFLNRSDIDYRKIAQYMSNRKKKAIVGPFQVIMGLVILVLLALRLISCTESAVEVKNIKTQAGYVLRGEPIDLISGFSELIHVIDVQDIADTIHKLRTSVSQSFIVKDSWLSLNLDKKN